MVRLTALALAVIAAAPPPLQAQVAAPPQADAGQPSTAFSAGQLDQMLAPIALYPDDLLSQVLMAATYPLEVVEASRWLENPANAALKGDDLAAALEQQPWDPSVKALVPFPQVLAMLNQHLDWTQQLGDAFLGQQAEVMDSVQRLRRQAEAAGHLQSTQQQVVRNQDEAIIIEPARPTVVYVPVYDPGVVYGAWAYPDYPPVYYPPPPGYYVGPALATGLAFGVGLVVVGALWHWNHPDWRRHEVRIDPDRFNRINARAAAQWNRPAVTAPVWNHDAWHHRGVAYRDPATRARFQPTPPAAGAPADRRGFRGFTPAAPAPQAAPQTAAPAARPALQTARPLAPVAPAPGQAPVDSRHWRDHGQPPAQAQHFAPTPPVAAAPRAVPQPSVAAPLRPAITAPQPAAAPPRAPVVVQPRPPAPVRSGPPAFEGFGRGADQRGAIERGHASRPMIAAPPAAAPRPAAPVAPPQPAMQRAAPPAPAVVPRAAPPPQGGQQQGGHGQRKDEKH